ncbi:MAG: SDR family NAD(P)-dependent oxidoreductase [Nitrospirae bacterium]|nr:SDR family NAD(P)-dependent oxidoreductase [Nitrospirota bacterium]
MVCLITGSSRGLGKAIAMSFGRKGHQVVVHCKDKIKDAEEVVSQIKEAIALKADAKNFTEVKNLIDIVIKKWGKIDVLINNAGITQESLLLKTTEKDFDNIITVNLKGPFNFIRAAAPYMIKQKSGHIINISSIAGMKGKAGLSAYSASKAGLIGLTLSTAKELGRYNIMVNAILPGYMLTDMGINSSDKAKETVLQESLLKKFSEPEKVAEFICHLSEISGITGQVFNLDSRII